MVGSGRKQENSVSDYIAKNGNIKIDQSCSEPLSSHSDRLWLMSGSQISAQSSELSGK